MSALIERCMRLAQDAGLEGMETGTVGERPALLVRGEPLIVELDEKRACLSCSFTGAQVLLQTGAGAYTNPDEEMEAACGGTLVEADLSRLGDEELQLHIIQAWKEHAGEVLVKRFMAREDGE